jgi:TonB family protein
VSRLHRISAGVLLCGALFATSYAFAASPRRAVVSKVPPVYPELARRMHVSGIVVVHVTILPNGTVSDTKIESGHALLGPAAQDAVKRWKFEPGTETSDMTVDVSFNDVQ